MKLPALFLCLLLAAASALAADPHGALAPDTGSQSADAPGLVEVNPRYLLMDTSGRAVLEESFAGRFQLISFGYTSCPSVCPGTLATMTLILNRLGDLAKRVQPLFISVDPERDTPEVLERYTRNFDPRILGLTGSPELIRRSADNFKVSYAKFVEPGAPPGEYSMDHSVGIYLVDPDGRFLTKFGYSASAEDITESLRPRIEDYLRSRGFRKAREAK